MQAHTHEGKMQGGACAVQKILAGHIIKILDYGRVIDYSVVPSSSYV